MKIFTELLLKLLFYVVLLFIDDAFYKDQQFMPGNDCNFFKDQIKNIILTHL